MPVWYRGEPDEHGDAVEIFRGTVWEMAKRLDEVQEENAALRAAAVQERHDVADELLDSAIRLAGQLVRTADAVGVEDVALRCRAAKTIKALVENVQRLQGHEAAKQARNDTEG